MSCEELLAAGSGVPRVSSAGLSETMEGQRKTLSVLHGYNLYTLSTLCLAGLSQWVSFSEKHPRLEKLLGNKTQRGFIWPKLTRRLLHVPTPKSLLWFAQIF